MNTETQALTGLVMVRSLISITTGTVAFDRAEAGDAAKDLPPSDLLSDGRKQVIDPKRLAPLFNCRRRVERLLARSGSPFLGSMLVPEDQFDAIDAELTSIEVTFNEAVDALVKDLPVVYAEWENKHPEWRDFLRHNRMTGTQVRERCRFHVAAFRPESVETCPERSVSARDAVPAVLDDIAGEAARLLDLCMGRSDVTQKVRKAMDRLVAKLYGFSMLDVRIAPSVEGFRETIQSLPLDGKIAGGNLAVLMALLRMMSDPDRMLAHGRARFTLPAEESEGTIDPVDAFFGEADVAASDASEFEEAEPSQPVVVEQPPQVQSPMQWGALV